MSVQNDEDTVFSKNSTYGSIGEKDTVPLVDKDATYKAEPQYTEPFDDELGCNDETIQWISICLFVIMLGVGSMARNILDTKKDLVFEDFFNNNPNTYSFQWVGDDFYYWKKYQNVNETAKCEIRQGMNTSFVSWNLLEFHKIPCNTQFQISKNAQLVLFKFDVEQEFRHSIIGQFKLLDIRKPSEFIEVTPRSRYAKFCDTKLMYSQDNDIYVFDTVNRQSERITTDGVNGLIYNGVTDWVYEEEIYGTSFTFEWSDDCKSIAYLKLNDTLVNIYSHTFYPGAYPVIRDIRYPKPGDLNPVVSAHVWTGGKTYTMDIGAEKDIYIFDLKFKNDSTVVATRLNRKQTKKHLLIADLSKAQGTTLATRMIENRRNNVTIETMGWIHSARSTEYLKSKDLYLDLAPINGYYHISLFNFFNGELIRPLTNGSFDDDHLMHISGNKVYIQTAKPVPTERSILCVDMTIGPDSEKNLTTSGHYWSGSFGETKWIQVKEGPDNVEYHLKNYFNDNAITIDDNSEVMAIRDEYEWPKYEFMKINISTGPVEALCQYPYKFRINRRYPLVVHVYGGPGSQRVKKTFNQLNVGLNPFLVNSGYVVCTFDGRGTGFQGEKYMKQVYKNLGAMEANDTIEFGKVLSAKIWTDETKISVWGWSYGGYVSILSALADRGVYRLAISGAPVTDWKYYDSVYTERYMVTPKENPIGYTNSSCLNQVNNQTKTDIFLIHGTGDDNVHPLNSFQFMSRLQEENIMFDSMFYNDKNHGLIRERGVHAKHLFTSILNRLNKIK